MTDQPWLVKEDITLQDMLKHSTIFVHAPPGDGKSTLALTLSEQCPDKWGENKERIWLEDIFYISVDSKGYAGFYSLNVVPRTILDLDMLMCDKAMAKACGFPALPPMSVAMEYAIDKAAAWLKDHPNGKIVIDTLSAVHRGLLVEFANAKGNSMKMFLDVRNWHLVFWDKLRKLPFQHLLYLAHSKAAWKAEGTVSDQSKSSHEAGKTLDDADIIPDLDGSAVMTYKNEAILEGFLDTVTPPGGKERKRYLYVTKHKGKEAKNRFEHVTATKGKLEPHLGKLLKVLAA